MQKMDGITFATHSRETQTQLGRKSSAPTPTCTQLQAESVGLCALFSAVASRPLLLLPLAGRGAPGAAARAHSPHPLPLLYNHNRTVLLEDERPQKHNKDFIALNFAKQRFASLIQIC
jgi:hypothetical protein